jgi:hypothetical protein
MLELYKLITETVSGYYTFIFILFVISVWLYITSKFIFSAYRIEMVEKLLIFNVRFMSQHQSDLLGRKQQNDSTNRSNENRAEYDVEAEFDKLHKDEKLVEFGTFFDCKSDDEFVATRNIRLPIGGIFLKQHDVVSRNVILNGIPDSKFHRDTSSREFEKLKIVVSLYDIDDNTYVINSFCH